MIDFDDEYRGHGGSFEIRKGKRVLVSMTAPADAETPVVQSSDNAAPEPPNAAEGSD